MKRYNPNYVIVLSGDHIYKMDYSKMLSFHKDNNADATIAVIDVDIKEASRFGIMNTNEDLKIYEFEEKPKNPKSTKASMGIYIFNSDILYKYLEEDENDPNSENDFGKNIIPKMLGDGLRLFAYPFKGYWKDVVVTCLRGYKHENPTVQIKEENEIIYVETDEMKFSLVHPLWSTHYIKSKINTNEYPIVFITQFLRNFVNY